MAKAKKAADIPKGIRIYDQFGQPYDIDDKNKLWEQALAAYKANPDSRIQFPISEITNSLEWGWWTCFNSQQEWVSKCGIPFPRHDMLFGLDNADFAVLREMLSRFGAYISWLEANVGVMEGRRHALKQGYEAAVLVHSSTKEKGTEKSKEADAIAHNETLRQTKRMQIDQETLIATAKGMLEAYIRAWETVSRVITTRMAETELATKRNP